MRQQPVRPLSALIAIFSVVLVIGIAMQFVNRDAVAGPDPQREAAMASIAGSPAPATTTSGEGIQR